MTLSAPKLVRYLLDIGAIDTASVANGDLMITDCTRRHRNFKVQRRHAPGCFVKQAQAGQALSDQCLLREAVCYWRVSSDVRFAALKPLLPAYRGYDGTRGLLVIELLAQAETITEHHQRTGQFSQEIATLLGRELGRVHSEVTDPGAQAPGMEVFPRSVPWILSIHTLLATQFERLSPANAQILSMIREYPEFQSTLDRLRVGWQVNGLIHGDMKWDNCLLMSRADVPAVQALRIIDWELADFGDVCWDAGAVFQSYLSAWILSMPQHDESSSERLIELAQYPLESMQPAIEAFWLSYVKSREVPRASQPELLIRCVQYAAARMIQTAYEHMSYAPQVTMSTVRMLQVSINVLTRPSDAIKDLLGLSEQLS